MLFFSAYAFSAPYGSGWYGEFQFSLEHEDNISRAYLNVDRVDDMIASLSIGGGYSGQYSDSSSYSVGGYIAYNDYADTDGLDNVVLNLHAGWATSLGDAYNSPWLQINGNVILPRYDESEAREGLVARFDVGLNRRFGGATVARIGARYTDLIFINKTDQEENRDAAFDTAVSEVYLGVDYEIMSEVFLFGEYAFRHGGFTSTNVSGGGPLVEFEAETLDPVFNICTNDPRCSDSYTYRVVGDMHRLDLGVAFPLVGNHVDLSVGYQDIKADGGLSYDDWFVRLGMVRYF